VLRLSKAAEKAVGYVIQSRHNAETQELPPILDFRFERLVWLISDKSFLNFHQIFIDRPRGSASLHKEITVVRALQMN
jgi:hypothetical protein